MNPLQAAISRARAKLEADRRADLLYQVGYFNESVDYWFAAALETGRGQGNIAACRSCARESAEASHLSAMTLIILENTP